MNSYFASSLESIEKTLSSEVILVVYDVQRKIVSLNKEAIVKVDLRFTTTQMQNSDNYTVISITYLSLSQQKA